MKYVLQEQRGSQRRVRGCASPVEDESWMALWQEEWEMSSQCVCYVGRRRQRQWSVKRRGLDGIAFTRRRSVVRRPPGRCAGIRMDFGGVEPQAPTSPRDRTLPNRSTSG